MTATIRIDPINRDIELIKNEVLSPEAQGQYLAGVARNAIEEGKEINRQATGHDPTLKVYVDGREGAPLESVSPNGMVLAEWTLINEVLEFIWDTLETNSPVLKGDYVRSHIFMADGAEADITDIPQGASEYVFINTQPYARKIEGADGRPPESSQAPDGVYEATAHLAKSRFGNIAKISFEWRSLNGSSDLEDWARQTRMESGGHRRHQRSYHDWLRRQPAIVVTVS